MDDDNSENIIMWIFSFIIIIVFIVLLFMKVSNVASNQEFYSKIHSFKISNIIDTFFLDDGYFKTSYNLGSLKDVSFSKKNIEDKYNLFILEKDNVPYKNVLFAPKDFELNSEGVFSKVFVIEKKDNKINFKKEFVCEPIDDELSLKDLSDFEIINKQYYKDGKVFSKSIILVSSNNNQEACKIFYALKNFYNKKNVLLLRLDDDKFKTFTKKEYLVVLS